MIALRRLLLVALSGTFLAMLFLSGCKTSSSVTEPVHPEKVAPAKLNLPSKKDFNKGL